MKKKLSVMLLVALVGAATLPPAGNVNAQEAGENSVTQGELALLLVNVLGLARDMPSMPTEQQAIRMLLSNGIRPADGWQSGKVVVVSDLAVILVWALGEEGELDDPNDPEECIQYLTDRGIPMDTVGQAVGSVRRERDADLGGELMGSEVTDPLEWHPDPLPGIEDRVATRHEIGIRDLVVTLPEVVDVVLAIPDIPPAPTPVTPD